VTWRDLYVSDLQGVYALWLVPVVFVGFLLVDMRRRPDRVAVEPRASRFLRVYALVFTLETMLDPLAGGPLLRWLGLADHPGAMAVVFLFVLLGDFRVLVLVFGLEAIRAGRGVRRACLEASAWTFLVPVSTFVIHRTLTSMAGALPAQALWLIYELGFLVVASAMRVRVVPARVPPSPLRRYLRTVLTYVATYYALWAAADGLILATGMDQAWALRMIPNQLYYAFYVPFVYALGFSRRYAATSSATQPSR
jgi:hypothetical protein